MKKIRIVLVIWIFFFSFLSSFHPIFSQSTDDELKRKKEEIEAIQKELDRLSGEKQTLASTIKYLDNKIRLTQAQINATEKELDLIKTQIADLTQKIFSLDESLEELTALFLHRVSSTYKNSRLNPILSLLATNDLSRLLAGVKYLQSTEKHNRYVIYQMETTRTDYEGQKILKEEKEAELAALTKKLQSQRISLAGQQKSKQQLLEVTRNDEKRFQSELAKKMAELEAIQSIIAGHGDESEVGGINEGDTIASIIPSSSACSTGAHLHFEVVKDNAHRNPADFLSGKSVTWDNSPDGTFGFNGSWRWPIDDPIRITQGYGMTFFASVLRHYGGNPHTGIDMINNDRKVKAVKKGTLYRGAIACGGGTLRYVHVKQEDGHDTYYLHVNY